MGNIKLTYQQINGLVTAELVALEIEKGLTFELKKNGEEIIIPPLDNPCRVKWICDGDRITITVDDTFFNNHSFFDALLTTFIYNLQDFGKLRLESIEVVNSDLDSCRLKPKKTLFGDEILLGTVLKPYYMPLTEKLAIARKLASYGLNIIKEDETYLVSKEQIIADCQAFRAELSSDMVYVPNITSYVNDYSFIDQLMYRNIKIAMVNILVAGLGNISKLKMRFPELTIWGHRVGYTTIESVLSMRALAVIAVVAGIDFLHIGTPVKNEEIQNSSRIISNARGLNPNFRAIFSKTSPEVMRPLIRKFGSSSVIMACGYFRHNYRADLDFMRVEKWVKTARSVAK